MIIIYDISWTLSHGRKILYKVDTNIFDGFDLSEVNDEVIIDFKKMRFKFIFRENIKVYARKILSKIKKIKNFFIVIRLINVDLISNKDIYLNELNI